jgi:two-component sensor histidine kinase
MWKVPLSICSNSAKYGVLSGGGGRIAVDWHVFDSDGKQVVGLTWSEVDGPEVASVGNGGFGSVVLKRVAPQALSGTADLQYSKDGLVWTLEAPVAFVEASLLDGENS